MNYFDLPYLSSGPSKRCLNHKGQITIICAQLYFNELRFVFQTNHGCLDLPIPAEVMAAAEDMGPMPAAAAPAIP